MSLLHGKQISGTSVSLGKLDGTGIVTFAAATMSFESGSVLRTEDSNIVVGNDVVNKNYVDAVASGLDPKASSRVIFTDQDITQISGYTYSNGDSGVGATLQFNSGSFSSIDGVSLNNGDRVIINSTTDQFVNGIYVYGTTNSFFTRSEDFDGSPAQEVDGGEFSFVTEGDSYADTGWVVSEPNTTAIIGTSSIIWTQFSAAGVIIAGNGLSQTGNTFNVVAGTGITVSSSVSLTDTAVSPGSYGSVTEVSTFTVDQQGRLTAAGELLIDITSGQVNNFTASAESVIFTDANFVDGSTVTFSVTAGDSVTAEVVDGSLGTGKLDTDGTGATAGYILSNDGSGNFVWILNDVGDITEVTAGAGLTGGGTTGSVTLEVNTNNGIEIVDDFVGLGGTLIRSTNIDGSNLDLIVGNVKNMAFTASTFTTEAGTVNIKFDSALITDNASGEGLVYEFDYTSTFVTHSLITKQYVDQQVLTAGTITEITAGDGLIGGGTGGNVTIDVVGGTGINVNPDDIEIDFTAVASGLDGNGLVANGGVLDVDFASVTGTGLTHNGSQISVDFTNLASTLAGDGLTSSGSVLDVQVDTTGLNINGSNQVALNTTITGDRTFSNSVTIQGNLIVEGTQSIINTENIYIEDNIITLNATYSGPYNVVDVGIEANLGGGTFATLIWDASESLWAAGFSGSTSTIITEAGIGLTKSGNTLSVDTTLLAGDLAGAGLTSSGGIINVGAGTGITVNADDVEVNFTVVAETIQGSGLSASGGTLNIIGGTGIGVDADGVYLNIESITGGGLTQSGGVISVDYTTVANNLDGAGLIVSGSELAVNTGLGITISTDAVTADLGLDGGLTFSGNGIVANVDNSTIQIINGQLVATTQGDITAVEAGLGLTGGSTSGTASLSIDFETVTGSGLTQSGGVISVDYTQLAGDGLVVNGSTLDVNTGAGITISSDAVAIDLASNSGLNTTSGLSIDPSIAGTGLTYSSGVLSVVAGNAQPVYQVATSSNQNPPNANNFNTTIQISSTPNDYSRVNVFVNGQLQRLGSGVTTADCYFGTQSGSAVLITDIEVGYTLFWNGLIAGFRIDSSDSIDIIYEA